jgi:hypothetical protein
VSTGNFAIFATAPDFGAIAIVFQLRNYKITQLPNYPIINSEELMLNSDRSIRKKAPEHDMINPLF